MNHAKSFDSAMHGFDEQASEARLVHGVIAQISRGSQM
jgi:hypothetical protein